MTGFRAERGSAFRGAMIGTLLVLAGGPALAQGAPIPLVPPSTPTSSGTPAAKPGTVSSVPLAPPRGEGTGLLAARTGGLPDPLWTGTPRVVVDRLLPELPAAQPSPTLRDLARRFLLTAGEPPEGAGESIAVIRLEQLAAMGLFADVEALAEAAPALREDGRAAAIRQQARLLAGDLAGACARVSGPAASDGDAQALVALCQLAAGQGDAAALTVALLRDQGYADAFFLDIAESAASGEAKPPQSLPAPSALHLALLRAAGLPAPIDPAEIDAPALAVALASNPADSAGLRAAAAERAAALGALDGAGLVSAYRAIAGGKPVPATEPADALSRAALLQSLTPETAILTKVETVARAVRDLPPAALAGALGAPWAEAIAPVEPPADAGGSAAVIARLLLAQGRGEQAKPWIEHLGRTDRAAADRLWPMIAAAAEAPLDGAELGLTAWVGSLPDTAEARRRAADILTLFAALGETVPASAWSATLDSARRPVEMASPALLQRLREASLNGAVGETVLLALVLAGGRAPAEIPAVALGPVVSALKAVGLKAEARALVREAVAGLVE